MARPRTTSLVSWRERRLTALLAVLTACAAGDGEDSSGLASGGPASGTMTSAAEGTLGDSGTSDGLPGTEDGGGSSDEGVAPLECTAPQVACGQLCTDLAVDPSNCGQCGISCVDPGGEASCADGECRLGSCDPGFADCDSDPDNGCEQAVDCVAGGPCVDEAGMPGVNDCTDPCVPVCGPAGMGAVESCNALDDDLDAVCDEGPIEGCRKGIHRANGALGHFYTDAVSEVTGNGFSMEAQDFFFVHAAATPELVALYRCNKATSRRFLTVAADCEGTGAPELTLGYLSPDARCDAIPLYRMYLAASDDHFYTTSAPERDNAVGNLGYQDQGITGYVFPTL